MQFIASITPPKNGNSTFPSPNYHSPGSSFGSSFSSLSASPSIKQDPLFESEFFEVRESSKGGYGAFATKDIEIGTIVQREKPAFRAIMGEIFHEYEGLTVEQRAEYRSLHGWSAFGNNRIISIFKTNRYILLVSCLLVQNMLTRSSFELSGPRCGIFLKSSRFNHACHPHATCTYRWNEEENTMVFTAINPMKAGDEITIQYTGNPAKLYTDYGFYCDCPSCPDPKQAEAQDRLRRRGD